MMCTIGHRCDGDLQGSGAHPQPGDSCDPANYPLTEPSENVFRVICIDSLDLSMAINGIRWTMAAKLER